MRGSRAPMATLGVAAMLIAALGGSALAQSLSPGGSATPLASPPAAGSPSAQTSPMPPVAVGPITWKMGKNQKDFTANPAAYGLGRLPDGRLMLVGSAGKDFSKTTGAAWVSTDGSTWKRVKGLKAPARSAVIAMGSIGPLIVVTGTAEDGTGLTWTSADGSAWSAAVPMSGAILDLTTTPSGLIGVGVDGSAAAAWTTADGISWQEVTIATSGRALHVMTAPDGSLVSTGEAIDAQKVATPVIWNSADGVTWTQATLDGLVPGQWFNPSAASTPAGLVATFGEHGQTGTIGHAWSSTDGHTWTESFVDQDGALRGATSAGTDALLIGPGQVFRSPDGVTWNATKTKAFDGYTVEDAITMADGRLLAAGDYFDPVGGGGMATWVGTADPLP